MRARIPDTELSLTVVHRASVPHSVYTHRGPDHRSGSRATHPRNRLSGRASYPDGHNLEAACHIPENGNLTEQDGPCVTNAVTGQQSRKVIQYAYNHDVLLSRETDNNASCSPFEEGKV
jgi:hypothetical protein